MITMPLILVIRGFVLSRLANQRRLKHREHSGRLTGLETNPEKRLKYLDFIDYYAQLSEDDWQRYCQEYATQSQDRENAMRMRQYLEAEAWRKVTGELEEKALRKAEESFQKELRSILLHQVRRRFGEPTAEASASPLAAIDDTARLKALSEMVVDCQDGEAWLAELRKQHS